MNAYDSKQQMLMLFQLGSDRILMCNVCDRNQDLYEWKESKIKLNDNLNSLQIVLGWDQILFIFDYELKCIECIDLLHQENGWYVNDIIDDKDIKFEFAIKDNQNNVHLLHLNRYFIERTKEDKTYHFKVSLSDLIPSKISEINQKEFETVVIGYCRRCENEEKLPFIPDYIQQLILRFYTIFV